jgi:hypothetical protein
MDKHSVLEVHLNTFLIVAEWYSCSDQSLLLIGQMYACQQPIFQTKQTDSFWLLKGWSQ